MPHHSPPPADARIAIVMLSAIGDSVHVLPVVNALKRALPDCRVTWIVQPVPATLVRGHPAVDELLEFDPYRGWPAWAALRRALAARPFDLVIDLQVALKGGLVTGLARAPRKLGFDRARARDLNWLFTTERIAPRPPAHVQEQYFEFLAHLGVPAEPVEWRLGPWPEERERQRELVAGIGAPYAAINLASSRAEKDWLPERWAAVIDRLQEEYGLRSVLVGGPSEREVEMRGAIERRARYRPVDALGSGLRPLVALLDGAELVLALDSAPLHIAVALDRPVVSLMANADPRRTGPFRRFHDLVVDAYHDPGEEGPISMQRRPGRMPRISVEEVMQRVELWKHRYREGG